VHAVLDVQQVEPVAALDEALEQAPFIVVLFAEARHDDGRELQGVAHEHQPPTTGI
jgi:hypothetical protein